MKSYFSITSILFGFLVFASPVVAQDGASEPDLTAILENYFEAYSAINQLDTDMEDLLHFNSFFTADISYEIPQRDMVFQGEDFLSSEVDVSGRINNTHMTVDNIIVGSGVVFVRVSQSMDVRRSAEDDWQSRTSSELLVFEFEGDKIKRVIDY